MASPSFSNSTLPTCRKSTSSNFGDSGVPGIKIPSTAYTSLARSSYLPIGAYDLQPCFREHREAVYLAHFVQKLAPVIDICDPLRHFGTQVPKRASENPLLMFSILSFASRDWALVHGQEDVWSTGYSSRALQLLIPIFDGPIEFVNEDVLAAIVLLRLYEEMTESDAGTHLLGSTKLLNSVSSFAGHGGLGEAASWIVLRQQLYLSITRSEPVGIHLRHYMRSSAFEDCRPESLTNRIIVLCSQVLIFLNSAQGTPDCEGWIELRDRVVNWHRSIPWALKPVLSGYVGRDDSHQLPDLWIPRPVQVIAYQHFYSAMLLLAVCDPKVWNPGAKAFLARSKVEVTVRRNLLMVCALAISNPRVIVASLTAHHMLFAYGAVLKEDSHRRDVLNFLGPLSTRSGWPTATLIDKLRQEWSEFDSCL